MNSFVVGIDLGEKESSVAYMAPDGDIREEFKFFMNSGDIRNSERRYPLKQE
jgi:molecular chaperone DnaK (HSP70)